MSPEAHETRTHPSPAGRSPSFGRPPVVEVAISVQFEPLDRFGIVHFGLLWERIRDRFPETSQHPPLAPVVEQFGTRMARRTEVLLESPFPVGRCWYRNSERGRLIQVQPDRFVLNWQKVSGETSYPSYDALRGELREELAAFLEFVADYDLGTFEPTQCEVIYVNHLLSGEEWTDPSDLATVLTAWRGTSATDLPPVEDLRLAWQYRFDDEGQPLGRLYVELQPAIGDGRPLYSLRLVARGAPEGSNLDGVLAFTDRAHGWVTEGFTAVTTERVHTFWKREA